MKNYKWIFILALFIFLFLHSCSNGKAVQEKTYIISSLAKTDVNHFINLSPPSEFTQNMYYSQFNFILDSTGILFYYFFQPREVVGDSSISKLLISYLRPGQLIQVPKNSTIDFLKCNILNTNKSNIKISIASVKDTIKSKIFNELYLFLKDSTKSLDYIIRPATKEEILYLYCKKKKEYYSSEGKFWDSVSSKHFTFPVIVLDEN